MEGGEAFEGDDESGGFAAVHGQHDMRGGPGGESGGKVLFHRRPQALATAVDAAGVAVQKIHEGLGVDGVRGVGLKNSDAHAAP